MKFKFKGRNKSVGVIFSEGDVIDVSHERSIRMMRGHPHFEEVTEEEPKAKPASKRGKSSGGNKS